MCLIIDIQCSELDGSRLPEILWGSESIVWGGPIPASLLAFPEVCRVGGEVIAMAMVQGGRVRDQRLIDQYRAEDLRRGAGVEIDYMERGRHGGVRQAPGTRGTTAAGTPQGAPVLQILRALPLPLPPPVEFALDEPRYFPTCAACQEDAVQGQEWAWFGAEGGCGHGMHPQCWMQYMTHSAQGPRPGASAQGHLYVQCPTCRKTVTSERAHARPLRGTHRAHPRARAVRAAGRPRLGAGRSPRLHSTGAAHCGPGARQHG